MTFAAVLSRAARMRSGAEFGAVVRAGRRTGRPTLVLHTDLDPTVGGVRVGFVVSKAVGNAVVRNRVKRRLRHLVAARLEATPGLRVVVRALPAAGRADSSDRLADDLASAWSAARRVGWVRGEGVSIRPRG